MSAPDFAAAKFLSEPPDPTAGEAEHAALLRVAEAAERVREYPRTHTTNVHERDLDKALAELRRARGEK